MRLVNFLFVSTLAILIKTLNCAQVASVSRYSTFRNEDFKIYAPESGKSTFEETISLLRTHFYRSNEFDESFWSEMIRRFGHMPNQHDAIEELTSRMGDVYTKHIVEAGTRREAIRGDIVTAGIKVDRKFDWFSFNCFVLPRFCKSINSIRSLSLSSSKRSSVDILKRKESPSLFRRIFSSVKSIKSSINKSTQAVKASDNQLNQPTATATSVVTTKYHQNSCDSSSHLTAFELRRLLKIPSRFELFGTAALPVALLSARYCYVVWKQRFSIWGDIALWLGCGAMYLSLLEKVFPLIRPLMITEFSSFLPSSVVGSTSTAIRYTEKPKVKSLEDDTTNNDGSSRGLCVGDQLVMIDGQSVVKLPVNRVHELLNRGREGDSVEIGVLRPTVTAASAISATATTTTSTADATHTAIAATASATTNSECDLLFVNITKRYALAKKVHTRLRHINTQEEKLQVSTKETYKNKQCNVGYIAIDEFTARTCYAVEDAIISLHSALRKQHPDNKQNPSLSALVLDLQGNGGGTLSSALDIAAMFLPYNAPLLRILTRKKAHVYRGRHPGPDLSTPLLILTDGNTASASEILAAALRDSKRAQLAGSRTLGKNIAQAIVSLSDDTALSVTVAEFRSPAGLYMGDGIETDLKVPLSSESTKNSHKIKFESIRFNPMTKTWSVIK